MLRSGDQIDARKGREFDLSGTLSVAAGMTLTLGNGAVYGGLCERVVGDR